MRTNLHKGVIAILGILALAFSRSCHAWNWLTGSKWRVLRTAWMQALWKTRLREMGESTTIYPYVMIHAPDQVSVGARVAVAEFVHIWGRGGISIGNDVLIASHVVITSQTHDSDAPLFRSSMIMKRVVIEDNVWIGAGAVILPGTRIGQGAIVGAGSVVTSDIPPHSVAMGIPARIVRKLISAPDES